MAQSVRFLEFANVTAVVDSANEDDFVPEFLGYYDGEPVDVEYDYSWWTFGEGENGLDTFIEESKIREMLVDGTVADVVKAFEVAGYTADCIERRHSSVDLANYLDELGYYDDHVDECGYNPYIGAYDYDC